MDSFAVNSKKTLHVRSNSLPSKPHPIVNQVDEHLCRLKSSEATSSTSSLCHRLNNLQDLHDCIDKLLLLPFTQQTLVNESDNKWTDDFLEGSLKVLELCDIAKDALLQTKECVRELESVLRRRRDEAVISRDLQKCLSSRKMIKKVVQKALKGIKSNCSQQSEETSATVSLLKEVEAVTFSTVESVLSFIAGRKLPSRWSFVSKLIQSKRVANKDEDSYENEVDMMDATLSTIASHTTDKSVNLQDQLRKFESSIQDLEEDLESLQRHLIKNRVSLLNILNH
ncbi:hypothetical protein IC582_001334 [Cucumis melo]|uniref:Uncharacterized protein LOC103490393 n=2 Tax=Cucumis melo TaxID=3656 RepID=A0A1S3BJU7_CUCME|nr:uncharacterized protein LOC103490393 [Cucumis melo]TYK23304.1 uncharacterized protein E5676_scaffold142G003620 [Cucumis melo var. makuwa]